ncbi:GNAT family N-acetyltransferase [Marivita hallyeonensis]|uniref:L-ornithine N(alpha)-acyltransferase n=1 Tax=Marivita hallyeonensis TaxID=996342 RepID=A0A1M5QMN7_9RHOB|nr:GNAT family N-acetyltransferase [Marivita hallyeonensis]SHH15246.1 ornithine-acyl[acyl carrier protein] N-acyltransferase [Marivita hallyeonensis]
MALPAATEPVADGLDEVDLRVGPYRARIGIGADLREAALELRGRCFRPQSGTDRDRFDALSLHGTVCDTRNDQVLSAFRTRVISNAAHLSSTYTAQSYDLTPLQFERGPFVEVGRLCHAPDLLDPMAFRLVWAALGALVDTHGAAMMIGCSSFDGTDVNRHRTALAYLRAHHLGPQKLRPGKTAVDTIDLPNGPADPAGLPHLLKSYLGLGSWVSDFAVRDPDLDRLHVFTALRIGDIPEPRKRRLRALARGMHAAT